MRQAVLVSCATLLLVVLDTNVVNAECCPAQPPTSYEFVLAGGMCADGTKATPYCGYGPCNVFGCNCDGGCRHRRDAPISDDTANTNTARDGSHMDTNRDGLVDSVEAIRYLRMSGVQSPEAKVSSFDQNADGYLSNEELNAVSVE